MAWENAPTLNKLLGANYTADANTMELALEDFPNVTEEEAAPADGDTRRILFGMMQDIYRRWKDIPQEERPEKMTLYRTTQADEPPYNVTFSFRFFIAPPEMEVDDEDDSGGGE